MPWFTFVEEWCTARFALNMFQLQLATLLVAHDRHSAYNFHSGSATTFLDVFTVGEYAENYLGFWYDVLASATAYWTVSETSLMG